MEASSPPTRPLARLAVTVALPALVGLAWHVRLPGVASGPTLPEGMAVLALGLEPFLTSYLLVELAALAVPRWRPLRVGGRAGRAPLEVAAVALGLALAVAQGYGLSDWLQSNGALLDGLGAALLATLTLAAGSAALLWVASLVGRYGLGNGFAVMLAAWTLSLPFGRIPAMWPDAGRDPSALPVALAIRLLVYGILAAAAVAMLLANDRAAAAGLDRVRLRDPASGLVPIPWASSLLLVPATLSGWFPSLGKLTRALQPEAVLYQGLLLAAALSLGVLLSRLFHRPRRVAEVWSRLGDPPSDAAAMEGQAEAALRVARVRAAALLALFVLLPAVSGAAGHPISGPWAGPELAFAVAAVADVLGEWRARRALGGLVSLRPEHRLYAVDAALEALRREAIPAFARGVHYRTLGQFFAPYVPVEIMVPAPRAAAAEAILRRVLPGEDRSPRPREEPEKA